MLRLVISDVHMKVDKLKAILGQYDYVDQRIFLGDWWDTHEGYSKDGPITAINYLNEILSDPKNIYIAGNHDLMYLFPDIQALGCSGWEHSTEKSLKYLTHESRRRMMRLHYWVETEGTTWLLSHAGVHPFMAHPIYGMSKQWIDTECQKCLDSLSRGQMHYLVEAGKCSGGRQPFGGITWLRWNQFEPIPGINQIVGHSFNAFLQSKIGDNSRNYCMDTGLNDVFLIGDHGEIESKYMA